MVKPVAMCQWNYDEEKKETVKTVLGYLPGQFEDGLLVRVLPNNFAQPVATPELAMELVNQPAKSSEPIATVEF